MVGERSRGASGRNATGARGGAAKAPAPRRRIDKDGGRSGVDRDVQERRRRRVPSNVRDEIVVLGGRRATLLFKELQRASDAFQRDHDREAARILRPLRDELPDSPSIRELLGLVQYRIGNYAAATKELEAYIQLSGLVDQHPVLMDCYRAQKRWRKVEQLWLELGEASPSAELVTEGRIVMAGSYADQGRTNDALGVLRRRSESVRNPKFHHLRLWYALADLEERAGNVSAARALFARVGKADPAFADVAERLATLS